MVCGAGLQGVHIRSMDNLDQPTARLEEDRKLLREAGDLPVQVVNVGRTDKTPQP